MIFLDARDLGLAALLVLGLAVTLWPVGRRLSGALLFAALRTVIQLLLVGQVLQALFAVQALHWVALMALVMLLLAGYEAVARQRRRLRGVWHWLPATLAMALSSFAVTSLALVAVIGPTPWYQPQYAIPLLGMLLGNSLTGVALGLERLMAGAAERRDQIEARLMLGHPASAAISGLRQEAMHTGLIPTINAMAAAGVVSLPGMMTGQILAGTPPGEAVKYQILIMFLIAVATGFAIWIAVTLAGRRLFDSRQRLRLDRLRGS